MIKIESSTEYYLVNPNNIRYISVKQSLFGKEFNVEIHYMDGFALLIPFDNREAAVQTADGLISAKSPQWEYNLWI